MARVRVIYNRQNFFYEDPHTLGMEFEVFRNNSFPGMWLLYPGNGYIGAPGLWFLETDCEEIEDGKSNCNTKN